MKVNSGHFIADGNAVNVEVGFVPDFIMCFEGLEETNPAQHFFFKELANTGTKNGQYGMVRAGTGTVTSHAAATNGFATYDTYATKQMISNPAGGADLPASLPSGFVAATAQPTARSATAIGTITKPSVGNETGLVYECTTSAGVYGTEPTWPTVAGDTVTDDQSNVWTARESKIEDVGAKGFTLGATGSTDTDEWAWVAYQFDKVTPEKDSASNDPV